MIADKIVYCLNTAAVGDLVACSPVLKYAIDNFHRTTSDYKVGMHSEFRDLFPFIPDDKIVPVQAQYEGYAIRFLNMPGATGSVCRMTPSRMNLTHYASINLLGRVIPEYHTKYPPLNKVDVSHFNIDFSKCVVIMTTYRDKQRTILASEITKIAEYVQSKGLVPIYAGKVGAISIWKNHLAKSDFEYPGFGIDLRDKTSFLELTTIMGQAKAVVGMDSGPIHLAFTTDVPVACGFTVIAPEFRIPYRGLAKTEAVVPNIFCNFCESNWSLNLWNFQNCPRKMEVAECVTKMTSTKFIAALEKMDVFKP